MSLVSAFASIWLRNSEHNGSCFRNIREIPLTGELVSGNKVPLNVAWDTCPFHLALDSLFVREMRNCYGRGETLFFLFSFTLYLLSLEYLKNL
jgi:hypothetical protein